MIVSNVLTELHGDWVINVANIIGTNLLTKFHEDRKINVASRVLIGFYYSHIRKNATPPGGHVFQPTGIIFELVQDIIGMNLLTKFHEDQTINVASRVHIKKNLAPLGSHVFQAKVTIFKLIEVNKALLTPHNGERTTHNGRRTTDKKRSQKITMSTLCSDIIGTNLLTKFHVDRKINVASRVLTSHVFQSTGIIFELVQDIIRMNLLTKLHKDQTVNVTSRVLTRFYYSHLRTHAPPL
ncbi:hypothetical protein DPMN_193208 [Dreissena polymorpha]|uniref:Uncharacterized protein n=1 Tax=Dreissena polymorpha TaxID=45954 RepID=A0A9D3Y2U5_DREPO|nr:hypothetical protein DPMN_193208 [Dreissena polymorpha]